MSRRSSSVNVTDSGISRMIGTDIEKVRVVADNIGAILLAAGVDLPALAEAIEKATDFTGIRVEAGTTAAWDPNTKTLTVPTIQGIKGDDGASISITNITAGPGGVFTWEFSDGTLYTTPSLKGSKGDVGEKGATGDALGIVSIIPRANGSFVWTFTDGTVYETPVLKGSPGEKGSKGDKGDRGDALTLDAIIWQGKGEFLWKFSDGTQYYTPDLQGIPGEVGQQGERGLQGISVHHMKGTNTTDPHGVFGTFGELDTYTFYGDADETIVLGWFSNRNGVSSLEDMDELGIMLRRIYDTNGNGIVDNSERLEGQSLQDIKDFIAEAIHESGASFIVQDDTEFDNSLGLFSVGDTVFVVNANSDGWEYRLITGHMVYLVDYEVLISAKTHNFIDIIADLDSFKYDKTGGTISGNVSITQNLNVLEDVTISGDLTVAGSMNVVDAETLQVEDNTIILNKGEVGHGVTAGRSGIIVDRGLEDDYNIMFSEATETFQIGKDGSMQDVATRQSAGAMVDNRVSVWDSTSKSLKTGLIDNTEYTTTQAEDLTSSTARVWTPRRIVNVISKWWSTIGTAFGKTLLGSADAAAARSSLGLGTAATSDVVQDTGQSTTDVISQKAVTDALDDKDAALRSELQKGQLRSTNYTTDRTFRRGGLNSHSLNLTTEKIRPVVSFIDDDGSNQFLTRLKPIFDSKGVKTALAIYTSAIDNSPSRFTWQEVLDLYGEGYEIMSHTHTNKNLSGVSASEAEYEFAQSRYELESRGIDVESFVYVQGSRGSNEVRNLVRKYFRSAYVTTDGIQPQPLQDWFVRRKDAVAQTVAANPTLQELKDLVDYAEANNEWAVFTTHAHYAGMDTAQRQVISDLIDYIQSKGIEILTPSKALDIHGSRFFTGDYRDESLQVSPVVSGFFKIDKHGVPYPVGARVTNAYGRDQTSPITDYAPNEVTVFRSGATVGEWPLSNSSGAVIVETYYIEQAGAFGFQRITKEKSGETRHRSWNRTTGDWDAWRHYENSQYIGTITDGSKLITDYPLNSLSVERVGSGASNFPESGSNTVGLLTTNYGVFSATQSVGYQTYTPNKRNYYYTRTWDYDANQWRNWVKEQQIMSAADKAKLDGIATGATNNTVVQSTGQSTTDIMSQKAVTDALLGKVNKEVGKGLSTNDFTTPLLDKLTGLEGSHWRGTFPTLSALQSGVTDAVAGDYADVDGGVGEDVTRYIWDTSDNAWVSQGSAASLTAAQVKQLYESNADTNAFNDANVTKLSGIEVGANKTIVVQETGNSEATVMSQKAVTDAISDAAAGQLRWGTISGDVTLTDADNGKTFLITNDATITINDGLPAGWNVAFIPDDSKDETAYDVGLVFVGSGSVIGDSVIGSTTLIRGVCSLALTPVANLFAAAGAIVNENFLTFSSSNPFLISFTAKHWDGVLEYSTDRHNWTEWDASEISSVDNVLYLRGTGNTVITNGTLATYAMTITSPSSSGVSCTGNIMSLLDHVSPETAQMGVGCFAYMFYNCTSLTTAPELPATQLADSCYQFMFRGTSLTVAPELPATQLAVGCYGYMLNGCTGIKISSTQEGIYQKPWRIPTVGTGTAANGWSTSMLLGTGGTFKGNPAIDTTYYQAG